MVGLKADVIEIVREMRALARALCFEVGTGDDLVRDALLERKLSHASDDSRIEMLQAVFRIYKDRQDPTEYESNFHSFVDVEACPLQTAFGQLKSEQREALILLYGAGLSIDDASRISGRAESELSHCVTAGYDLLLPEIAKLHKMFDIVPAGMTTAEGNAYYVGLFLSGALLRKD